MILQARHFVRAMLLLSVLSTLHADVLLRLENPVLDANGTFQLPSALSSHLQQHASAELELLGPIADPDFPVLQLRDTAAREAQLLASSQPPEGLRWICANRRLKIEQIEGDPLRGQQWALEWILAEEAWPEESPADSVILAIVDTGAELNHPDLRDRWWCNPGEDLLGDGCLLETEEGWVLDPLDLNGVDDDGNGLVDDLCGYDFLDSPDHASGGDDTSPDPWPGDEHGHGTQVAGIAAASRNNGTGIAGAGSSFRVMPLRVGNRFGFIEEDDLACALLYAGRSGARVINLSLGDDTGSRLLEDLVAWLLGRGITVVASSGNTGDGRAHYPSDYPGVISVGSASLIAGSLLRSPFSSFGPGLDLLAPGGGILTTDLNGQWTTVSGTSMAAPFVSAAAAMALARGESHSMLASALQLTARDLGQTGPDLEHGAGLLNLAGLLAEDLHPRLELHYPPALHALDPALAATIPVVLTARGDDAQALDLQLFDPAGLPVWEESFPAAFARDTLLWLDPLELEVEGDWRLECLLSIGDGRQLRTGSLLRVDESPPELIACRATWRLDKGQWRLWQDLQVDDPGEASRTGPSGQPTAQPVWQDGNYQFHALEVAVTENDWLYHSHTGHAIQASAEAGLKPEDPVRRQPVWRSAGLPAGRALLLPIDLLEDGREDLVLAVEDEQGNLLRLECWSPADDRLAAYQHSLIDLALYPVSALDDDEGCLLLASAGGRLVLLQHRASGWITLAGLEGYDAAGLHRMGDQVLLVSRSRDALPLHTVWQWTGSSLHQLAQLPLTAEAGWSWDAPLSLACDLDEDGLAELILANASGNVWRFEADAALSHFSAAGEIRLEGAGPGRNLRLWQDPAGQRGLLFSMRQAANPEQSADPGRWELLSALLDEDSFQLDTLLAGCGVNGSTLFEQGLSPADESAGLLLAAWPGLLLSDNGSDGWTWLSSPSIDEALLASRLLPVEGGILALVERDGERSWQRLELEEAVHVPAWLPASGARSEQVLELLWHSTAADSLRLTRQLRDDPQMVLDWTLAGSTNNFRDTLAGTQSGASYWLRALEAGDWSQPGARLELLTGPAPQVGAIEWNAASCQIQVICDRALGQNPEFCSSVQLIGPTETVQASGCWLSSMPGEVWIRPAYEALAPGVWRLLAAGLRSREGARSDSLSLEFLVSQNVSEPVVLASRVLDRQHLEITFSRAMSAVELLDPASYRFSPERDILNLNLDEAGTLLLLELAGAGVPPGGSIRLELLGLRDQSGQALPAEETSLLLLDRSQQPGEITVYPNPWQAGNSAFGGPQFAGLPIGSRLLIHDLQGSCLLDAHSNDGLALEWTIPASCPAGVYLWRVKQADGSSQQGKIAVIP